MTKEERAEFMGGNTDHKIQADIAYQLTRIADVLLENKQNPLKIKHLENYLKNNMLFHELFLPLCVFLYM